MGDVVSEQAVEPKEQRMHLHIALGSLRTPSDSIRNSGRLLVDGCLKDLNPQRHPPCLFVLWATKSFLPFEELLGGIHAQLEEKSRDLKYAALTDVPLIGASVAACMFDEDVHPDGAMLFCFGAKLMQAKVGVGEHVQDRPATGVQELLHSLDLRGAENINPRSNRFIMSFLPGFRPCGRSEEYRAFEIADELMTQTNRELHMFGGVSALGARGQGSQFLNRSVYKESIVAALITSDITYGIGINHGLKGTNKRCVATKVGSDHRSIFELDGKRPSEILKELLQRHDIDEKPWVFAFKMENMLQTMIVHAPQLRDDVLYLPRSIPVNTQLEIRIPETKRMSRSVKDLEEWLLKANRLPISQVCGIVRIGCSARYKFKEQLKFAPRRMLEKSKQRFPAAVQVGCYMDGELGINGLGNPELAVWSVAEALFADDVPAKSRMFLGFDALTQHMHASTLAPSVSAAMERCLQTVTAAGYDGGMISLVQHDGDRPLIVAHAAFGDGWRNVVMPQTRRPLGPSEAGDKKLDILAIVAKGTPAFVGNAQTDDRCRRQTAREGGIVSFYAAPLKADDGDAIGVLQIDLGNMSSQRELPDEHVSVLNSLGDMTAAALNLAIRTEELTLLRKLDGAMISAMNPQKTREEAIGTYAKAAANALSDHAAELSPNKEHIEVAAYVRIYHPEDNRLWLIDGHGPYYRALIESDQRKTIPIDDPSSSTGNAFRGGTRVVNNTIEDQRTVALITQYDGTPVGDALRQIASFADFPIGETEKPPIGTVSFSTSQPWFFSQARLRSLRDIGQRMSLLLSNIRRNATINFLSNIAPPLSDERHPYRALKNHLPKVARITNADCVSCFLWDETRDRFILRACYGWKDDVKWVDAAWYGENEGVTGTLAMTENAEYIPDLLEYQQRNCDGKPSKWLHCMFDGGLREDQTCEVIVLPLTFRGCRAGIFMLHRIRKRAVLNFTTGFTTVDRGLLSEARESLAANVYATLDYDFLQWREKESQRLEYLTQVLRSGDGKPEWQLLQDVCNAVILKYRMQLCAIYLLDEEGRELRRTAFQSRSDSVAKPALFITELDGTHLHAQAFRDGIAKEVRGTPAVDPSDPQQVKNENLVQGAIIPLSDGIDTIGILDLRWSGQRTKTLESVLPHHSLEHLVVVAKEVFAVIQRKRGKFRQQVSQNALDAMSYYLGLGFHAFTNGVTSITSTLNLLEKHGTSEVVEIANIGRVPVANMERILSKAKMLGDGLAKPERHPCALYDLLSEIVESIRAVPETSMLTEVVADYDIRNGEAFVDATQLEECFKNLITNATNEIRDCSRNDGIVVVRMSKCDIRKAWLVDVEDNGRGLAQSDFERHTRGSRENRVNSRSVGLFFTRLFCESNGCVLEYVNRLEPGTTLRVVVPVFARECPL